MRNHTAVPRAVATAACTLAIALLTTTMTVNSAWAQSDPPSGLNFTPISFEAVVPLARPSGRTQGHIELAQAPPTPCHQYAYRRYKNCLADAHAKADRDPRGTERLVYEQQQCKMQYLQEYSACEAER